MREPVEPRTQPSREQVRAARALLGLTAEELASEAGIGVATVGRFERGFEIGQLQFEAMVRALESNGILFLGPNLAIGAHVITGGVGIRRKRRSRK